GEDVVEGLPVQVNAFRREPVDVGDREFAEVNDAEERADVSADDALVVLFAPLVRGAVHEPVVAKFADGLLQGYRDPETALDLVGIYLVLAQCEHGVVIAIVHLALTVPGLVRPANAPSAVMLDRARHSPAPLGEQGRRVP